MALEELMLAGANWVSSVALAIYGIWNRNGSWTNFKEQDKYEGSIRRRIKEKAPNFGRFYDKISPTIEHFIWGYSLTAFGAGIDYLINIPIDSEGFIGTGIFGGIAFLEDLYTEIDQARERRKIWPMQFLGTCTGIATSLALNHWDKISLYLSTIEKAL